jgi:crotonobetainyl-CoA:carnitine CoA-transferase CaiB-like acyl-CoA transferase
MGETVYEGSAVELSRSPNSATKAAPCLGEDTREVLTTCLGYTDEEVDDLLEAGSVEIVLD